MAKTSILIPSRGENSLNLNRTIQSIRDNATGDYEIIVGLDGQPYPKIEWGGTIVIPFPSLVGIKTNINAMAACATGKYIYKSDAHCAFGKGFDEILQTDMEEDWIVMPRFKIVKEEDWSIQMRDGKEEYYDYFYLCCPFTDPKGFRFKAGGHWPERTQERLLSHPEIDETPQIHGSGWFMTKDRYFELGGFPNIDPYGHAQEPIWLALKNWLAGGKVMVNKKTWYAHMHQQGNKRGYHMDQAQENKSYDLAAKFFVGDKPFEGKKHDFDWFIWKFAPMPGWPDNWPAILAEWKRNNP